MVRKMIKLYADGADIKGITESAKNPKITGFTTNPTLMKQAGITDYKAFALQVIEHLKINRPETTLSLEVFADDTDGMITQARKIADWANDYDYPVYIKIPITNTKGEYNTKVFHTLSNENIKLNITAVFTEEQSKHALLSLNRNTPAIISIFAGRIADAGFNAKQLVSNCIHYYHIIKDTSDKVEFLWASSRQVYNYIEAERSKCDIITMTPDLIKKLSLIGKDLDEYSLDTVKMFYNDALASGYHI
jgi:transaldolase